MSRHRSNRLSASSSLSSTRRKSDVAYRQSRKSTKLSRNIRNRSRSKRKSNICRIVLITALVTLFTISILTVIIFYAEMIIYRNEDERNGSNRSRFDVPRFVWQIDAANRSASFLIGREINNSNGTSDDQSSAVNATRNLTILGTTTTTWYWLTDLGAKCFAFACALGAILYAIFPLLFRYAFTYYHYHAVFGHKNSSEIHHNNHFHRSNLPILYNFFGHHPLRSLVVWNMRDRIRIPVWYIPPDEATRASLFSPNQFPDRDQNGVQDEDENQTIQFDHYDPGGRRQSLVIMYAHGNSGTRAHLNRVRLYCRMSNELHAHVIAFDYRGYGDCQPKWAKPTADGVTADAMTIYRWLINKCGVPPRRIVVWGHSLGTAILVRMLSRLYAPASITSQSVDQSRNNNDPDSSSTSASKMAKPKSLTTASRTADAAANANNNNNNNNDDDRERSCNDPLAVILESPFTCFDDIIRAHPGIGLFACLPWFDHCFVRSFTDNPDICFDSTVLIGEIRCPMLMMHARGDPVLPFDAAKRLYESAAQSREASNAIGNGNEKRCYLTFQEFPKKCGHSNIVSHPDLMRVVSQFLSDIEAQ